MKKLGLIIILTIGFQLTLLAQENAYKNDVNSIEAIMNALTEVISGSGEEPRNWERFHYLFSKDAKLIPTQKDENGNVTYAYWTPAQYEEMFITNRSGQDFYEQEIFRITEEFGNIAHCFSTYAVKLEKNGPISRRGINSVQILKGNDRWYIMNVFWSNEAIDEPLPNKYLD
jgi:hypothetical protein